ncbi:MAG: hypothetical protein ACE5IC_06185 [Candidatus Brocadiales bacterium]
MILQCQACSKVKKFGEWVEVPEDLSGIIKDIKVIKMLCPQCQGNVSSVPSLVEVVLKRERVGTDAVDTVSLR